MSKKKSKLKEENFNEEKYMRSLGFEPIGAIDDFKMPEWMDCTWRRNACGKEECKICGRILRDRQKHVEEGEDPDSMEAAMEDVGNNLKEALEMIKKDAEEKGIDISNIDDIKEPPEPKEFPLYLEAKKLNEMILEIGESARLSDSRWFDTEIAQDLFWYNNTLLVKIYRQLCNIWHIKEDDGYGEFDYGYTDYVIKECLEILKQALAQLSFLDSPQKADLMLALSGFMSIEARLSEELKLK
jgi:hypothetical protein